jgi:hypothetical protein
MAWRRAWLGFSLVGAFGVGLDLSRVIVGTSRPVSVVMLFVSLGFLSFGLWRKPRTLAPERREGRPRDAPQIESAEPEGRAGLGPSILVQPDIIASVQCFYCEKNEALDKRIVNPMTNEVQPTCSVCEFLFDTRRMEREKYRALRIAGNLLLLLGVVGWLVSPWITAISVALALGIKVLHARQRSIFSAQRRALEADFAEERGLHSFQLLAREAEKLPFCSRCMHFRKVKNWYGFPGLSSGDLPDLSLVPCKVAKDTEDVWQRYFQQPREERRLYPTDCPRFDKR